MHIQHIINEASETCDAINNVFEKIRNCGKVTRMETTATNEPTPSITTVYEFRLEEYRAILRRADFFYSRADGQAYRDGEESYNKAVGARKKMLADFPEAEKEINAMWVRAGGRV